jgi:hypothetical protein
MVSEIILIAGLPGSGKTTQVDSMRRDDRTVFDDFKANAHIDSPVIQDYLGPSSTTPSTRRPTPPGSKNSSGEPYSILTAR